MKYVLILLGLIPIFAVMMLSGAKRKNLTMVLPTSQIFKRLKRGSPSFWNRELVTIIRLIALTLIIIAAARPQLGYGEQKTITQGVDIVLCIDTSGSMLAEDFIPDRLTAAKEVVKEFVREMDGNRLSLVAFSGKSFTQCPLTTDFHIIEQLIDELTLDSIPVRGTAIGDAIGNAINKFIDEKSKSRVIILLTDGENNTGQDPEFFAKIAHDKDIRIYAIGVGTPGGAPIPYIDPITGRKSYQRQGTQLLKTYLDEATLQKIADITKGMYFRATDNTSLRQIYQQIAQLEKHEIEKKEYTIYNEMYAYFLVPGLFLFLIEIALFTTRYKRFV